MRTFLKIYLLGIWVMFINLPRLLLGMLLVILPIFLISKAIFFVLPGADIVAGIGGVLGGLWIIEETRYGDLVKRMFPF